MKQLLNTIALAACFTVLCTAAKAQQAATKPNAAETVPPAVTAKQLKPAAPQQPLTTIQAEAALPAGRPIEAPKDRVIAPAAAQPANALTNTAPPETATKLAAGAVPVQTPGVKE